MLPPKCYFPFNTVLSGLAHADADSQNEWQSTILYGIEGQLMTLLCWSFCWYEPSAYLASVPMYGERMAALKKLKQTLLTSLAFVLR
jgi:hypothetical protein